jgi:formylglycine-generating enzyme required for sulfatase activity
MRPVALVMLVMGGVLASLLSAGVALAQGNAPVVSNVVAQQIPGTGNVRVTYDVSDADGDSVSVSVIFSSNNGVTYDMLPRTMSGDVNKRIAPGTGKLVTWSASADYPGFYYPQVVAKVIANDGVMTSSEMVLVPGGMSPINVSYQAGANVYISAFMLDKYEVTNAEYQRFIDAGGYSTRAYWSDAGWAAKTATGANWVAPLGWGVNKYVGPNYPGFPVTGVSWYEAEAYANFLGKRLPTEAEWEKALRGNTNNVYGYGSALDPKRCNYLNNGDPNDNNPTPVGYFNGTLYQAIFQTVDSPSAFGAYDLVGNVAEWMRDWYGSTGYPSGNIDPIGPSAGTVKVIKGGSFSQDETYLPPRWVSPNTTFALGPSTRQANVGFRLVRPVVTP